MKGTVGGFGLVFLIPGLLAHSLAQTEFRERTSFATFNAQHMVMEHIKNTIIDDRLLQSETCSNGITGVEAAGACCDLDCGSCGGQGCGSRARAAGLSSQDCCSNAIKASGIFCSSSGAAPCIIDKESPSAPTTPAPLMATLFTTTSSSSLTEDMQTLLDLHNEARCEHNADSLVYNQTVEATAQAYAEVLASDCGLFEHSEAEDRNYYGENLYMCWGITDCYTPERAMSQLYDAEVEADDVLEYGGHATQILWKSTTELGCAVKSCTLDGIPYEVLVCHYNPAGNVIGQYEDEVELPSGASC